MLVIDDRIQIPLLEFEFTFARSGGPGGQHVNKVSSKALLRWMVSTSPSLPEDVRSRFLEKYKSRITIQGEILISSQKHRDQRSNADECLEKLTAMLQSVLEAPQKRRPSRPGRAVREKRIQAKKIQGKKKLTRKPPSLAGE